jgi:hypothetical protein
MTTRNLLRLGFGAIAAAIAFGEIENVVHPAVMTRRVESVLYFRDERGAFVLSGEARTLYPGRLGGYVVTWGDECYVHDHDFRMESGTMAGEALSYFVKAPCDAIERQWRWPSI